ADKLGISRSDVVKLTSPHGSVELPAWVSPTLHPGTVAIAMGLGHDYSGVYAKAGNLRTGHFGDIMLNGGANPMRLLSGAVDPASGGLAFLSVKVSLPKTAAPHPLPIPPAPFAHHHPHIL